MKCNILKIFKVARCKRINCEVNLINRSILSARDTLRFHFTINEDRGMRPEVGLVSLFGMGRGIITFLELLAVLSGKYHVLERYSAGCYLGYIVVWSQ